MIPAVALLTLTPRALAGAASGGDSPAIGIGPGLVLTGILLTASVASVGVMRRQGILGPGAFRPPAREPDRIGWGFWAVGALLIYMVMPLGAQLALSISGDLDAMPPGEMTLRAMGVIIIGSTIAGAVAAIALLRVITQRTPDLGFRIRRTDPLWGLAAFLAALPVILLTSNVAGIIDTLIAGEPPDEIAHNTLRLMVGAKGSMWWWVTTAGVIFGAPIAEELLYRGFFQSSLVALTRSRWLSIGVTSVVFALVHVGTADLQALPSLFVLSIALGVAFERKGRIGVPIVMHALFNLFNVLISL